MAPSFFDDLRSRYDIKRRTLTDSLNDVGFRVPSPEGAYYLFADYDGVAALKGKKSMDAALTLINDVGVASVPGDNFYAAPHPGSSFLRFAFCRSLATLEEAAKRLRSLTE